MFSYSPRKAITQESGIIWFPVSFMRGGTSTGLVIEEVHAPTEVALQEELLRLLMGVPQRGELPGNRQITGLGRGPATSNKVFFVAVEPGREGRPRLVTTLAQLASNHARIDWSVNCGNMSSALPLWALHAGLADGVCGDFEIELFNTNTAVLTTGRVLRDGDNRLAMVAIPGVPGSHPGVDLFLHDPVGAKTGALLPTGNVADEILGVEVSCVDVAVPMVIIDAAAFGKTATESIAELEADTGFLEALKAVWVEAGVRMRLVKRDGALMSKDEVSLSETVPKVCIIGPPTQGGDLSVRYFTPQTAHASMAVSGGCCLAAATLIPGTVASRIASTEAEAGPAFREFTISMENPAGTLEAMVMAREDSGRLAVQTVAYRRSAQMLHQGHVPLYSASSALIAALQALR
ncbi:PrpF domain-containing protein [Pseudomonas sp. Marseille-QA0892]